MLLIFLVLVLLPLLNINADEDSPSIVIVGAGVSGIAAALKLLENGFVDVKVLEAKERIGGRIHSVEFGTGMVDLGAQFCYGEKGNVVFDLVKDLDLLQFYPLQHNLFESSGKQIDPIFAQELTTIFGNSYLASIKNGNTSLGEEFINSYNETIFERFKDDELKLKVAVDSLELFIRYVSSIDGALSIFDVSAKRDSLFCEGNLLLDWKNVGFQTLLDVMLKGKEEFAAKNIKINKEVVEVIWDSDKTEKASIRCLDGSAYLANHVIVTLPLGVLKFSSSTLFSPPLPEDKMTAIESLGVGAIVKIFFHFPNIWWHSDNTNYTDFNFIWNGVDKKALKEYLEEEKDFSRTWLLDLILLYNLDVNPNILEACFSGETVPLIESLPDDEIIEGVLFVLKKFVGHLFSDISNPDSIKWDKWYSDIHFRGSSSYQTIRSRQMNPSAEVVLAKPLNSTNGKMTLLFAGEATHPVYYSTVHGALESGYREADRITNLYK